MGRYVVLVVPAEHRGTAARRSRHGSLLSCAGPWQAVHVARRVPGDAAAAVGQRPVARMVRMMLLLMMMMIVVVMVRQRRWMIAGGRAGRRLLLRRRQHVRQHCYGNDAAPLELALMRQRE